MKYKTFTTTFLVTTILAVSAGLIPSRVWAKGGGGSHGGSVHVSGYTRKDGTYVAPYTRSAPGSAEKNHSQSNNTTSTLTTPSTTETTSTITTPSTTNTTSATTTPSTTSTITTPNTTDIYPDAINNAMSAATLTQSAVSKDDWELVSNKWQNAISLLKQLPNSSPNYVGAQAKIQEYGKNLNYARQQLGLSPLNQPSEESLTENLVPVATPASSPLSNTSTEPASSPASPQTTSVVASVSQPPQVAPTSSTKDSEHSDNNLPSIIFVMIVAVVSYNLGKLNRGKNKVTNQV